MFCSKCGKEIDDKAVICVGCGNRVSGASAEVDKPSGLMAVLSFFVPLVGLILYLVYNDTKPLLAKSAGKGALIGVIVSVALTVLFVIVYIIFIGALIGGLSNGVIY